MQDTSGERATQHGLWQRLMRTSLWPILAAEIGFTLLCLGVAALIWHDVSSFQQLERQQERLSTYRLQAKLLDQQLADQQQYLRQFGRVTRRLLQESSGAPPIAFMSTPALDDRVLLSPKGTMAIFGEAQTPTDHQWLDLARQLHQLEPWMNDIYQGDALIKRLYISLPQGIVAVVPGTDVPTQLRESWQDAYRFDEPAAENSTPLRWLVAGQEESALRLQVRLLIGENERQAQVGLELDTRRLTQLIQEYVGSSEQTWLIDSSGRTLAGRAEAGLSEEAGRRGVMPVETESGSSALLVWATLPTTGWRMVSLLPATDAAWLVPSLGWVVLIWVAGSLLILALMTMRLRYQLQRWERELDAPLVRMAGIRDALMALVPSWLASFRRSPAPSEGQGSHVSHRIDSELDALDDVAMVLSAQPQLLQLIEELATPVALTYEGLLVAANTAFEQLIGRTQAELQGTAGDIVFASDESGDGSHVHIRDGSGRWRLLRREWSRDMHGHGLILLTDESEYQYRAQQLTLARDHARQDSQLKTRYLTLLRRELDALAARLKEARVAVDPEVQERFSGLMEMLDSLSEDIREPASRSSTGQVRAMPVAAPRVLIVDDGPVNTALAHNVLSRYGLAVDTARGGNEALSLAEHQFYDLVFMDIYMPFPDGIETSRRWREREAAKGEGRRSVLIALTANASEIDREQFFSVGMDDYLAKPYRPQALIDMIHRWLPEASLSSP